MKERIEEILNDETITDVKARVDAIAKVIPLFTVPKDKYNSLSERLQNVETEKSNIETQYKELQQQNMTAEQLQEAKLQELQEREAKIARLESESAISKILSKSGITEDAIGEEEYKTILEDLIGEDQASSVRKATNFVDFMTKQKDIVEKETTTKLLNDTPSPRTGDGEPRITKEDLEKMTYSEEMEFMNKEPELYAALSKE